MVPKSFKNQVKENLLAIIGLVVAVITLLYITWSDMRTEENRTNRVAAFEILKNLGELQGIVNASFFSPENQMANPMLGWGHIAVISDLSTLMPEPIPETSKALVETWKNDWKQLKKEETSVQAITLEIDKNREAILQLLQHLK